MDRLALDLRQALRAVARSPLFALAVVATLGLGIGANTALFTVLDQPHGFWARRFGGDPAVVGRAVRLNGHPFTSSGSPPGGFTAWRWDGRPTSSLGGTRAHRRPRRARPPVTLGVSLVSSLLVRHAQYTDRTGGATFYSGPRATPPSCPTP